MEKQLRVATWNIRGAAAARLENVVAAATSIDTDVLVITETARYHLELEALLTERGWSFVESELPRDDYRGVAMVVRHGRVGTRIDSADPCPPWSGVAAICVDGLTVIGLYAPGSKSVIDGRRIKEDWWRGLHSIADAHCDEPAVMIGDFNVGVRGVDEWARTFHRSELFLQLADHGFVDGWRELHGPDARAASTWSRTGHPFRLDHVHASRSVDVLDADYLIRAGDHQLVSPPGNGDPGLSDHAALVATVRY